MSSYNRNGNENDTIKNWAFTDGYHQRWCLPLEIFNGLLIEKEDDE